MPKTNQTAIKERARAADALAAAHKDYARAVARYEVSTPRIAKGDQSKGPAAEMVQLGDRVVQTSDAFAETHGRAEEVLSGMLEERGRCLREAMASVGLCLFFASVDLFYVVEFLFMYLFIFAEYRYQKVPLCVFFAIWGLFLDAAKRYAKSVNAFVRGVDTSIVGESPGR